MKIKNISIIILALGVWMFLFSTCRNIKRSMTSKEERYALMKYAVKLGKYPANVNFDAVINDEVSKGYLYSSIEMLIAVVLIICNIILLNNKTNLRTSGREAGIHAGYWLMFISLVGLIMSGFGNHFSSCTIDWIYMFLVAGLTGFYASYLYLNQYFIEKMWKVFFWGMTFSAILGSALSVFHMMFWSSFLKGDFSAILQIEVLLSLVFYSFISFVHIFIAMIVKNMANKIEQRAIALTQ